MQAGPRFTSLVLASLLAFLTLPPLQAQTASLVTDLATTEDDADGILLWGEIVPVQNKLFFLAFEPNTETQLWVSDGTTQGTRLLPGVCPDRCSPSDFRLLGALDGALLFTVRRNGNHGLWRSDGTREGTFALTESFVDGAKGSFLGRFLYFPGYQSETGCEIWRSDGTREGTGLVEDLTSGAVSGCPKALTVAGNKLYFLADGTLRVLHGGARTSTVLATLPSLSQLTAAGDRLFFLAENEGQGEELWTSDGTAAGTRRITRFAPEKPFLPYLTPAGRRILFLADDGEQGDELWESDGTPGGTRALTDFVAESPFGGGTIPRILGDRFVINATDQEKSGLWAVTRNPRSLTFLPPCPGCETWSFGGPGRQIGTRLVFPAEDEEHGIELWVTDGTVAGTRLLRDLCPGRCSSFAPDFIPDPFRDFPQGILFVAGKTLWRTDGTPKGTNPLTGSDFFVSAERRAFAMVEQRVLFWGGRDSTWGLWEITGSGSPRLLAALPRSLPGSSDPAHLTALGDRLFFTTCLSWQGRIWQTAGTAETTSVADEENVSCSSPDIAAAGGLLYYFGAGALWRTDGTPGGTRQLTEGVSRISVEFAELAGQTFFPARGGTEIWRTDGTLEGTGPAIFLRQDAYDAADLTALGGHLYFMSQRLGGRALWRSDGTDTGTRKLADFSDSEEPAGFTALGPLVFFAAEGSVWGTDGTPGGTFRLPGSGGGSPSPSDLTLFQGSLHFFVDSQDGQRLWRSNGTPQGTVLIREFPRRDYSRHLASRHSLTVAAGRLFFIADDGLHGLELWTTDGTAAGTVLVRDIWPGRDSSDPGELIAAGGRLFFTADDGAHGVELWQSDGTAAGTRLVHDLAPESLSSSPRELTPVGSRLFFSAYEPLTGRELWVLPLSGPACQPSSTRLCLNNGRFQVEAVWRERNNAGAGTAVPLTGDTGYFWFFDASNVEVVLKVLDGRGVNDHFWVFYGALSDVEYTLTVTDTQTGLTRRYFNPPGQLASLGDTRGFGPLGAHSAAPGFLMAPPSPPALVSARTVPAAATGTCQSGPRRLCLNGGRFAVEASWKDFRGNTGPGTAVPLTGDTGYFWFFDAANIEVVLKVLDGTPVNGRRWVFYGALSNVEYTLTVTDTQTGAVKEYRNPSGRFASMADIEAF